MSRLRIWRHRLASVRARVLLLIVFMLLVVLAVATLRSYERRQTDLGHALRELQAQADRVAAEQAVAMGHARDWLALLTQLARPQQLAAAADCPQRLGGLLRSDSRLAQVLLTDRQGRVICRSGPAGAVVDLSDRPYFQQALRQEDVVLGDPVQGRYTQRWVFPLAQRYNDARGQPQGVVVAGLDMAWITATFMRVVGDGPARMGLVREDGVVLARYPESQQWTGRNVRGNRAFERLLAQGGTGTLEEISHDGERRIYAFSRFAQTPSGQVYLWINVPREHVTAAADRQQRVALGILAALGLVVLLLAALGSDVLVVRPLQAIMRAARDIAAGNPQARSGLPHGEDEIGQLARTFDEMAHRLTRFDTLTGLLNETAFVETASAQIQNACYQGRGGAILRVALENQRSVEAHFGQARSHDFIRFVSARLSAVLGSNALLARLEDGSFAALCEACTTMDEAGRQAQLLESALAGQSFDVEGVHVHPEVCIGISAYPVDGRDAADLLRHAGVALNHARADARTRVQFFEPHMNDRMLRRMQLTNVLRVAIEHDQLELHYQPQLDLRTRQVAGFEALVRWRHPTLGYVSPAEFVPLAEESGLILPLGAWVLREAVRQRLRWRTQGFVGDAVRMAVNISPLQLLSGRLDELLTQSLQETGLPAACVELEITEGHLLDRQAEVARQLQRFNSMGVQVAVDDFGTGYSSLAYLKQYAVDKLKIDKSFIDGVTTDPDDQAIVRATIAMAHALELTVIAEGVETAEQVQWLRAQGCDQIQGYYYSRPQPADELTHLQGRQAT